MFKKHPLIRFSFCIVVWLTGMMLFPETLMARDCPRCHGSGRQLTIPDVGHYGVERHKRKCPVCGQMVFSGHRDPCTVCGGSGSVDDRMVSRSHSAGDRREMEGIEFYMRNLTSDEYELRQQLLSSLFLQKFVVDTCDVCHGSRNCTMCGGFQSFTFDADPSTLCRMCGGTGQCIKCRGQGTLGSRYEMLYSDAERERIARNCGVINELAQLRDQRNISPGDENSPYIDIDDNGNYFIQERFSGGRDERTSYDDGRTYDSDADDDSGYRPYRSRSSRSSHTGMIAGIVGGTLVAGGAATYLFIRRRRK